MLKDARIEEGLTQRRLAELSGVPRRTIQNWEESGFDNATVKNAVRVSRVLGRSIEELLDD